jgi:hypothetical protein
MFGIGIVLFTFGDVMFSNYTIKKKSNNTNTLNYRNEDKDELKKLIDIMNNQNLSNSYNKNSEKNNTYNNTDDDTYGAENNAENDADNYADNYVDNYADNDADNDEIYTDIVDPEDDQYMDTNDSTPVKSSNMAPSVNKVTSQKNTILDPSLSELISMSNSMIDFHKPKKMRVRYDEVDTENPRFEDYAPVDTTFISSNNESKYVNQLDFPENTSTVLPDFNGDNVAQLYPANNNTITNIYDTINSDIYKGYKTWHFI